MFFTSTSWPVAIEVELLVGALALDADEDPLMEPDDLPATVFAESDSRASDESPLDVDSADELAVSLVAELVAELAVELLPCDCDDEAQPAIARATSAAMQTAIAALSVMCERVIFVSRLSDDCIIPAQIGAMAKSQRGIVWEPPITRHPVLSPRHAAVSGWRACGLACRHKPAFRQSVP